MVLIQGSIIYCLLQAHNMNRLIQIKRIITFLLFLLFLNCITYSQGKFIGFALNPKLGAYGSFSDGLPGTNLGVEFSLLVNRLTFGLDYQHSKFKWIANTTWDSFNQFDLLLGRNFDIYNKDSNLFLLRFQIEAGLGSVKGTINKSKSYSPQNISTLGFPVKLGIKHLFSNSISFGVDLQANLNSQYPIYMIMASLELGKLKK